MTHDNAAFQDTDDAEVITVLAAVRHCANSWEGGARLVGNVRAADISRACNAAIKALSVPYKIKEELGRFHRNSCYPDAMDGELEAAADKILAITSPQQAEKPNWAEELGQEIRMLRFYNAHLVNTIANIAQSNAQNGEDALKMRNIATAILYPEKATQYDPAMPTYRKPKGDHG